MSIYSNNKHSNYLIRAAIEAKIPFALCLSKKQALTGGKSLACEDKCSKKIGAALVQQADRRSFEASAVPALVYFYIIMIVHKCQQSAAQSCLGTFELRVLPFGKTSGGKLLNLLSNSTDRTFENRRSRYKELGKKVPQAYRVYVEDTFLPCDAGDARIFSKEMTHTENQGDNDEQKAKRYYYHSDHLGSAQFVTDWRGKQYEHIEYTPYGELWIEEVAAGLDKLPFRFTGKELDEETGLYYYGARYLDPKYSRWLSGDPALNDYMAGSSVGEGGIYNTVNFNVYHYGGNNPIKYTDPTGLWIDNEDGTYTAEKGDTLWKLAKKIYNDGALWKKFGYSEDQAKNISIGDKVNTRVFESADDASISWARQYLEDSISQDKEFGSTIFNLETPNGDSKFSYTNPNIGTEHGCSPSFFEDKDKIDSYIHSHGAESGPNWDDENFSKQDIKFSDKHKINGYLVTPSGVIKKYDALTGKESTIFDILPKIFPKE